MLYDDHCNHGIDNFLFAVNNLDVYRHENTHGGDENMFCVRFGNKSYEYITLTCQSVERRISFDSKYGDRESIWQGVKDLLIYNNLWDTAWDLTPEVKELI